MAKLYPWIILCLSVAFGFLLFISARSLRTPTEPSPKPSPQVVLLHGRTMGSTYSVRYTVGAPAVGAPAKGLAVPTVTDVRSRIELELESISKQISGWQSDSEISQFNVNTSTDWYDVSSETALLVDKTLELSQLSNGRFDVTIAPLIDLWGFGSEQPIAQPPSDELIYESLKHIGWQKIQTRLDPPALRKLDTRVEIDLSAIGAGAAADRVSSLLEKLGLKNHFIEVDGDRVTRGRRSDGSKWQVDLERPNSTKPEKLMTIELEDACIATSGAHRNDFEASGRRFAHILDPTTGRPAESNIVSVTAIAPQCSQAAAIATTLLTLESGPAMQLADRQAWSVILVVRHGDTLVTKTSTKFREWIE